MNKRSKGDKLVKGDDMDEVNTVDQCHLTNNDEENAKATKDTSNYPHNSSNLKNGDHRSASGNGTVRTRGKPAFDSLSNDLGESSSPSHGLRGSIIGVNTPKVPSPSQDPGVKFGSLNVEGSSVYTDVVSVPDHSTAVVELITPPQNTKQKQANTPYIPNEKPFQVSNNLTKTIPNQKPSQHTDRNIQNQLQNLQIHNSQAKKYPSIPKPPLPTV